MKKAPLGSGQRFKALEGKLASRGVSNPAGLAAAIGRKKYGSKRFGQLSAVGRKRKAGKRRYIPMSPAKGSGRKYL